MQAIILAAGEGKRLRSYYPDLPKPLVPLRGRPLVSYTLDKILKAGIKQIYLIIRPQDKEKFEQALRYYSGIKYLYQREPEGTAKALLVAEKVIKGDFLLSYCDLITNFNYRRLIDCHEKFRPFGTLVIKKDTRRDNEVLIKGGKVIKLIEKPKGHFSDYTAIGLMVLSPRIFKYLKRLEKGVNQEYHIPDALGKAIGLGEEIRYVLTKAFRLNVNCKADLDSLEDSIRWPSFPNSDCLKISIWDKITKNEKKEIGFNLPYYPSKGNLG